jgi:hypothetical protein
VSFVGAGSHTAVAQSSGEPELPRVFLSTSFPATSGTLLNVPAGGNLQATLESAQPGDTVVLQAGAVYTGNFILPAKIGDGWITIRTSDLAGIPVEGTRISPTQGGAMPKIVTANAAPALATAAGAHHYRLVGLEMGVAAAVGLNYGIVVLGDGSQSSLSAVPHDLVIDRCYVHGNLTGDVSRGVTLNSAFTSVIDSHISACHGVGFDTQAIAGWNGQGPFKIVNNYLEAAGENVMFGGADPHIPNLVPSDIEFRRNYCSKPLSWNPADLTYAGTHWSVKNLFELKNAQRILVDGNVFENCWVDGQTGFAVVFTPRNQEGTAPWSVVQDVTFTNNIARHAAAGIQFLGTDNNYPSQQERRIKIKNNLFYDIGGTKWGGNGRLFQLVDGTADVHIDHNTGIQTGNIVTADGTPHSGFVYTNNITPHNDYGFMGSGRSFGNDTLSYYFPGCYLIKNVIIGGLSNLYPSGNFFPASLSNVGFVDVSRDNYRLTNTSPFKNAATDGSDIGADQDAIIASIGGEQQPPTPTNQPPQVNITSSSTGGPAPLSVGFVANGFDPDGSIVTYNWDFGDGQVSSQPSVLHLYQTAGTFNARVTVTDNLGASATASIVILVTSAALSPDGEIVLYASGAPTRVGAWTQMTDVTAAGGKCIWNPDVGTPKLAMPVASPPDYFEMTFNAVAGRAYRLWLRGKAQGDSPYNDSVFFQFSGSVNSVGAPVFRIGTTDATTVNLEDCFGCGLQGWGWQDNGWGVGVLGPLVYFSNTGTQTLRVQVREDGLMIDQIVLSPQSYLFASPGALKNDTRILQESVGLSVTNISAATPSSGATSGGTTLVISGGGFTPGAAVSFGGTPATSVQVESATSLIALAPYHSAGVVDIVVTNPDGRSGTLLKGYTYVDPLAVNVLYPNGGETLTFDSTCIVSWSVTGGSGVSQDVYVSLDGGSHWSILATGLPSQTSSLSWRLPRTATTSARIRVRASNANGESVEDISDHNFAIGKKIRTTK